MTLGTKITKSIFMILFSSIIFMGCGDSDSDDSKDPDVSQDDRIDLTLKTTYELPYVFGPINQNVILDEDSIIFAGGNKANPSGAQHDGHPAFSNKAIKIDLITGNKQTLDIHAISGHVFDGGTVADGRGNIAKVYKYDDNKYLVYGGVQYTNNIELLDFSQETVIDQEGYYLNAVGSSVFDNGDIGFFGVNNNFGGSRISIFSKNTEKIIELDTTLTMERSSTTAHKLADGRIIILGGWDGSAEVTLDSATRRVEIFNPDNNSITRVADYPTPITNHGNLSEKAPVENDSVCVGNYQYTVSQNKWESGCNININLDSSRYSFPDDDISRPNPHTRDYLKTLSNGDIIFMEMGTYSSTFSDDLRGYPVELPTKIYIYSKSN